MPTLEQRVQTLEDWKETTQARLQVLIDRVNALIARLKAERDDDSRLAEVDRRKERRRGTR